MINYHVVREAVAAKIMVVGKEDGDTNLADLFTKILTGERRNKVCYVDIYSDERSLEFIRVPTSSGLSNGAA